MARATFLLTFAYLIRDRDVKLRIYPAIAPMLALPILFLVQQHGRHGDDAGGFTIGFAASYLSVVPMMVLNLLQYSRNQCSVPLPFNGFNKGVCHLTSIP